MDFCAVHFPISGAICSPTVVGGVQFDGSSSEPLLESTAPSHYCVVHNSTCMYCPTPPRHILFFWGSLCMILQQQRLPLELMEERMAVPEHSHC